MGRRCSFLRDCGSIKAKATSTAANSGRIYSTNFQLARKQLSFPAGVKGERGALCRCMQPRVPIFFAQMSDATSRGAISQRTHDKTLSVFRVSLRRKRTVSEQSTWIFHRSFRSRTQINAVCALRSYSDVVFLPRFRYADFSGENVLKLFARRKVISCDIACVVNYWSEIVSSEQLATFHLGRTSKSTFWKMYWTFGHEVEIEIAGKGKFN